MWFGPPSRSCSCIAAAVCACSGGGLTMVVAKLVASEKAYCSGPRLGGSMVVAPYWWWLRMAEFGMNVVACISAAKTPVLVGVSDDSIVLPSERPVELVESVRARSGLMSATSASSSSSSSSSKQ